MQGLNYVAALLLLVMKTEEDAFWMLAVLLENVLVNDCYTNNLSGCHVEQRVFKDLLAQKCPRYFTVHWHGHVSPPFLFLVGVSEKLEDKCRIATHLEALEFDVSLVATEWFLCLFSKSLPSEVRLVSTFSLVEILMLFPWLPLLQLCLFRFSRQLYGYGMSFSTRGQRCYFMWLWQSLRYQKLFNLWNFASFW